MNNFWQFVNTSETEGELILYGPIASKKPWWSDEGEGIYASQFTKDLKGLGNISHLTMRINSGGGDVFAANAIYAQLKAHAAKVTAVIEGVAASAATTLLAAADTVKAPSNATVMVHDPLAGLMGYYNKKDLEKVGNVLETVKASIINGYISKTGRSQEELSALMDKETWMTAQEAMAEGFVDEILYDVDVQASMTSDKRFWVVNSVAHDLSGFESRPALGSPPTFLPQAKQIQAAALPFIKANTKESDDTLDIKNVEDLKKHFPDLCNQLVNDAATAAASAERERIKAIDAIAPTIAADMVAKAKYEEPIAAEKLAFQALTADAGKGIQHINAREAELNANGAVKPGTITAEAQAKQAEEAANVDLIAAAANQNRKGQSQ